MLTKEEKAVLDVCKLMSMNFYRCPEKGVYGLSPDRTDCPYCKGTHNMIDEQGNEIKDAVDKG